MKRILTVLLAVVLAFALAVPAFADDTTPDTPTTRSDVAVVAYTVTNTAGGEVTTVNKGDHINIVAQIADYSTQGYEVGASNIAARINCTDFTYTGTAEVGQLATAADSNGAAYLSYNLLFRDVVYNGTANTLPINLSYVGTTLPYQTITLTLGQCVIAKDEAESAKTPGLMVRSSGYGEVVTAGEEFTLALGVYATDGSESLNDVVVTLTLPENVSLSGGSLTNYIGTITPKTTKNITFQVLPSAGFSGTVADIGVTLSGTGANSGAAAATTPFTVSVPVTQPNRFELGQLDMQESIVLGDTASLTLNFVNKGKQPLGNMEARLTGTNVGPDSYQYLGNLNAGSEGSVDFDITPDSAGAVSGVITLTYEDANGKVQTVTKEFSATAEDYSNNWGYDDPGIIDDTPVEPEKTGMPIWGWALIVLGAVVVIVVIVVVMRKRKKAKALARLDEDSDEDI